LPSIQDMATVNSCMIVPSVFSGSPDEIDLQSLSRVPMRVGNIVKMEINSTSTNLIDAVSINDFNRFDPSALQNLSRIVWTYRGEKILLKKGNNVSSWGTLTLRYPRMPIRVKSDGDYIDVPDSPLIDLVIYKLRNMLAQRVSVALPDETIKLQSLISMLYGSFAKQVPLEEVKNKVQAIQ